MTNTLKATDRKLDYAKLEKTLVDQIRDYVTNEAKSEACIVGVSGGIDSADVSTLAAKTELKTILLTMPIEQAMDEVTRADKHIEWLKSQYPNVISYNIDLTSSFNILKDELLKTDLTEDELYLSLVNTRSRLRMATLYAIANASKGLVIGTGNKVEDYGIGFFTKFGDGGVDYSPIGELGKSEVYKLGEHMGVIKEILEARPTDGLHPNGATDEDQIGATYDELEWAMEKHDEFIAEIATNGLMYNDPTANANFLNSLEGREYEVMKIYTTRHFQNGHKMEMPPVARID